MAPDALLDRNGLQGAEKRGLAVAEDSADEPRARVERHWLVLAVATLLTLAFGSRVEDANALKRDPSALRAPPKAAPERSRIMGVFRLGLSTLSRLLAKGRMWRRLWLLPEPWPPPPEGVKVVYHPEIRNLPL